MVPSTVRQEHGRLADLPDARSDHQALPAVSQAPAPATTLRDGPYSLDERPAIARLAEQYARHVAEVHGNEGNAATLMEIERIRAVLADHELVTGGAALLDETQQAERHMALRMSLDAALQPVYTRLVASAHDHFDAIVDDHDFYLDLHGHRRLTTEAVQQASSELAAYVRVLPADQAVTLVQDLKPVWTPVIASIDSDFAGTGHSEAIESFAAITDRLAMVNGGEAVNEQIIAAFAQFRMSPSSNGLAYMLDTVVAPTLDSGRGYYLMTGIINQLYADGHKGVAAMMLDTLARSTDNVADQAEANVLAQAANREVFYRIVAEFAAVNTRASDPVGHADAPDVGAMELDNALAEYMTQNPAFVAEEVRLGNLIDADARSLLHMQLATSLLHPDLLVTALAHRTTDRLAQITANDPANGGFAQIHASSTLMLGDMMAMHTQALLAGQQGIARNTDGPTIGALNSLNTAYKALAPTLKSVKIGNLAGLEKTSSLLAAGIYFVLGIENARAATANDNPATNPVDRFNAGVESARYFTQTGRDGWKIAASWSRVAGSDGSNYELLIRNHPGLYHFLNNGMAWLAVASDTLELGSTLYKHRNDLTSNDALIEAGLDTATLISSGLLLQGTRVAFGAALAEGTAAGASSGPWMPAGLALALGVTFARYQYDRVVLADRFETAEIRQALAHIGSLDDTRQQRAPREISDRVDHDPQISPYDGRAAGTDTIIYAGLSAGTVDKLLNNSNDPDNPQSALPVLSALAQRHGMTGRDLLMHWFDSDDSPHSLSERQRKELIEASFAIDFDTTGISDHSLTVRLPTDAMRLRERLDLLEVYEKIEPEHSSALMNYLLGNQLLRYPPLASPDPAGLSMSAEYDVPQLRALVGLGPLQPGQPEPSAQVREAARALLAGVEFHHQFRPDSLEGLEFWLMLNDYPPIVAPADRRTAVHTPAVPDALARPAPVLTAPAAPDLSPATVGPAASEEPAASENPAASEASIAPNDSVAQVQAYTVRDGDTLWSLAGADADMAAVLQLIETHNAHNADSRDFDPARIDGNPFTGATAADKGRDPDLIRPGDIIYLPVSSEENKK